jgi:plastocyanin
LERRTAWENFELLVGHDMAIERLYYLWDQPFPTEDDYWSRDQGRTLFLSWETRPSTGEECASWADIAAGLHDAEIDERAEGLKAFGAPVFLAFDAEANVEACGTPEDFVAAWRHIHARFADAGVTTVTWAWTMSAFFYRRFPDLAEAYYPGGEYVDVIGGNGHNFYHCKHHPTRWHEPRDILVDFHDFATSKGKPMVITEYGTGEDRRVPGRKAEWFANVADLIKDWQEIKAVAYYNTGNGSCDRYVDSSYESLDAFQAMAADPYFNPPAPIAEVAVEDFAFGHSDVAVRAGTGVRWAFKGPSDHTVTDASGMGLFDSGVQPSGGTFTEYFIAAGAYAYACTIHPELMVGNVKVPIHVDPVRGDEVTAFTISWAIVPPPAGYAFDIQIRRPGDIAWSDWLTLAATRSAEFIPDGGPGIYSFRARYRDELTGLATGYSDPGYIEVSP